MNVPHKNADNRSQHGPPPGQGVDSPEAFAAGLDSLGQLGAQAFERANAAHAAVMAALARPVTTPEQAMTIRRLGLAATRAERDYCQLLGFLMWLKGERAIAAKRQATAEKEHRDAAAKVQRDAARTALRDTTETVIRAHGFRVGEWLDDLDIILLRMQQRGDPR